MMRREGGRESDSASLALWMFGAFFRKELNRHNTFVSGYIQPNWNSAFYFFWVCVSQFYLSYRQCQCESTLLWMEQQQQQQHAILTKLCKLIFKKKSLLQMKIIKDDFNFRQFFHSWRNGQLSSIWKKERPHPRNRKHSLDPIMENWILFFSAIGWYFHFYSKRNRSIIIMMQNQSQIHPNSHTDIKHIKYMP